MVIGGRQSARQPPERNVVVIGQEYTRDRDTGEVVQSRHVVGSRYGGASSGVTASRSSSGGSQFTVIGAGFRKRRSVIESFLKQIL